MNDPNYGYVGITPIYTIEDNVARALAFQRPHTSEEVVPQDPTPLSIAQPTRAKFIR